MRKRRRRRRKRRSRRSRRRRRRMRKRNFSCKDLLLVCCKRSFIYRVAQK